MLEAAFADLAAAYALPRPVYQYWVTTSNGEDRFIDFAYPDLMLAIEVDGFETPRHGRRLQSRTASGATS